MRKIKFKVWLKKEKEMYSPLDFTPPTKNNFSSKVWVNVDNNTILLQFTGLYDKNGKEIYEGDVVKCRKMNKVGDGLLYGIQLAIQDTYIVEYKFCGFNPFNGWVENNDLEWEIIGNIFENPELLK